MRIKIGIFGFLILLNYCYSFPTQKHDKKINAYLTINFQNPVLFKEISKQDSLKHRIEKVFKKEGINILPEEKVDAIEEHKLYFYITISDSLNISANSSYWDLAISKVKYPNKFYAYKNESDILKNVKKYLKELLHHKHK
ncbi:MAG: hypothetical protein M1480_14700 [Bacteroidetes bacterium]|nr:hypothetical protein [Bacteroidota bacterium]